MLYSSLFTKISQRMIFGLTFLLCYGALAFAVYAQYFNGAEPCPLCIVQRIVYAIIGLISLIAFVHNPKSYGNIIYGIIILALAVFGAKLAYHHMWLQSLPPEQWPASCGMPLSVLYKRVPLGGFIRTILSGSAECAMVTWKMFGISAVLLSFCGYVVCGLGAILTIILRKS